MNKQERDALIAQLTKDMVSKGKLIEAGFTAMRLTAMHPDAPPEQVSEMRLAFFAGAQHLFGSIMGILDEGRDPTDADMLRMEQISNELEAFILDYAKRTMPTKGSA